MTQIKVFWHRLRFECPQARLQAYSGISPSEKGRVDRLIQAAHREQALASFWARRQILAAQTEQKPQDLDYAQGAQGRPSLPGLEFNLSHSEDWSVLAFCRTGPCQFGIDLELADRKVDHRQLAPRFFESREVDSLRAKNWDPTFFFQIWTAKEAYLKSLGVGLHKPLDSFRVAEQGHMLAQVLELQSPQPQSQQHIVQLAPPPHIPQAVAHLVVNTTRIEIISSFFDGHQKL